MVISRSQQALLLRGSRVFDDLPAYRRFVDEVVGRRNARNGKRIALERAALKALPARRSDDFEETLVNVVSTGGFALRKVFYTVPSKLIGHRLRVRLYDDHLDCWLGSTLVLTLRRGRPNGNLRGHVINYRHVIHALKQKPMALLGLVYRDQLFPRPAYARAFDALIAEKSEKEACRCMVGLLALAHERVCEADLADVLDAEIRAGRLPDPEQLRRRFEPIDAPLPEVAVHLPKLAAYDAFSAIASGEAA